MRAPRLISAALAAAMSAAVLASGALAGAPTVVRDANDTAGPLDLAAASAQIQMKAGKRSLVLRLRTYQSWDPSQIGRPGAAVPNFLSFEFDRNRRRPADRCLGVAVNSAGALVGQMNAPCVAVGDRRVGRPVRVRRSDSRHIEVVVPSRLLGRSANRYTWRATSSFQAAGHKSCAPLSLPPPEQRYGRCADLTRFTTVRR